jgi:hypothetical protein
MPGLVKRTIYLPSELAEDAQRQARATGKTFSAVVRDALVAARARRLHAEFSRLQEFWSAKARAKGVFTEEDLDRYLRE